MTNNKPEVATAEELSGEQNLGLQSNYLALRCIHYSALSHCVGCNGDTEQKKMRLRGCLSAHKGLIMEYNNPSTDWLTLKMKIRVEKAIALCIIMYMYAEAHKNMDINTTYVSILNWN